MKKLLTIFLILINCNFISLAQPGTPCELDPDDASCHDDEEIPLDSGVTLLLIGGVLYGLKKIKENKIIKGLPA